MNLTKKQLFLLKEVLSKAKMNEVTGKYTIYPEDYIFLNLNKRTTQMLARMCQKYNIDMEILPERISCKETTKLFERYNEIKNLIKDNPENKTSLEREMIDIKQTITLGYIEVVYLLINKTFKNLLKEQDSEDIYQVGYETLIWSIDKYDTTRGMTYTQFIKEILIHRISEEIWKIKRNTKNCEARDIITILESKDILSEEELAKLDSNEIKNRIDLNSERIDHLLSLIDDTYEISYEELPETSLITLPVEESFLEQLDQNIIDILLETLPKNQQQILKLYYGFIDGKKHTNEEIGQILGYNNRERVRQIKELALTTLSLPIYINFINSYYENDKLPKERTSKITKTYKRKREEELIDSIIKEFPKDKLIELIEELPEEQQQILKLYYGIIDNINYNIKEISKILNLGEQKVKEIKRSAIKNIVRRINQYKQNSNLMLVQNYIIRKLKKHN